MQHLKEKCGNIPAFPLTDSTCSPLTERAVPPFCPVDVMDGGCCCWVRNTYRGLSVVVETCVHRAVDKGTRPD